MAEPVEDTQALSVIEFPAPVEALPKPVVAAKAALVAPAAPSEPAHNPFSFEPASSNSPAPARKSTPAPKEELEPEGLDFPTDSGEEKLSPRKSSRDSSSKRSAKKSGGKGLLILGLLGGLLLGLGGAAAGGYYFFVVKGTSVAQTQPTKAEDKNTIPADTKKTKETSSTKGKDSNDKATKSDTEGGATKNTTKGKTPSPNVATKGKTPGEEIAAPGALRFPLPEPPKNPTQVIAKAKDRLNVDNPVAAVKAVRFSYGTPSFAAVLWGSFAGFQGVGAKDTVDLYSIQTGRRAERMEFPADGFTAPRLFDISPDGNRIVIEQPVGKLTVHDFDSKQNLLDAVEPFKDAPGLAGPPSALRFITPDRLAVFDKGGAITVWDLPKKSRIFTGPPRGPSGPKDNPAAVGSINGDRIVIAVDGTIASIGIGTGQNIGSSLKLPTDWTPLALASDSGGKQAALLYRESKGAYGFATIDVRDAKGGITQNLSIPAGAGTPVGISFAGSDMVVVVHTDNRASALIYEAENQVVTGYLKTTAGATAQFTEPMAGRHWWMLPDTGDEKKAVLISAEMPFEEFFGVMNQAKAGGKPIFLVLRPEGLVKEKQ